MKTALSKRIAALLLCCLFLLPSLPVYAAQVEGFRCEKTAELQPDGTVRISLSALQTGRVASADIVLVLDVSASMEHNAVVPVEEIDGTKDYYILYVYQSEGSEVPRGEYVPVHNTAAEGDTPTWFATLPDTGKTTQIDPADAAFYTGSMEELRAAVSSFVQSVADNAARYDADHRIAIVEFSARDAKGVDALCTHDNDKHVPFYANILTGSGTADGALVSAQRESSALQNVIAGLHGDGATYSDDAMTQAQSILASSDRNNRIVVLFTDGGPGSYGWTNDKDQSALPTANGAIAAAKAIKDSGVQIFTVGALNESDLSGTAGTQTRTYLNYISSNYPDAQSMTQSGEKSSDGYCTIGRTNMNLRDAFAAISAVIGAPVNSATVQDVVSAPFYLTDVQKQSLLADYPAAQIKENADGTTSISFADVDFPAVAVRADGSPVDPDDAGIFAAVFSVTPRPDFLGGSGVATNTGACGVFADGVLLAQFTAPQINVPINNTVLESLLSVKGVTLNEGDPLTADALYEDLSHSSTAQYVDSVTYSVTDAAGNPFTEGTLTTPQTFTVQICVTVGSETYTASKTVSVQVLPHEHTYTAEVTAPTCTTGGFTTYTCSFCGDSYVADETAALGHDYVGVVTNPTCTTGGFTTYTCSRCSDSYVADEKAALGHDYAGVVTKPTCTTGGFTTYTCSRCGSSYVTDRTAALGHNYDAVVAAPTCTKDGFTTYTCSVCGNTYKSDKTVALGHAWDDGVVTKEPTEKAEGVRTFTCTRCGAARTEPIAKLPASKLTLTESLHGEIGTTIRVNMPYGRKGAAAFRLTASENSVTYTCSSKVLSVDKDGTVRFKHLRLLGRDIEITARTADGKEAVCKVSVQIQWWHFLIWLLFGWIWY